MKPKVVYLGRFDTCCGVSTYTEQLAQAVVERGVEVAALCSDHSGRTARRACRESLVPGIPHIICWDEEGDLDWAAEEVIRFQPAVVHIQHEFGIFRNNDALLDFCATLRTATRGAIKVIVTAHTVPKNGRGPLEGLMQRIDHLVVHSSIAAQSLRIAGKAPCPITVIPHGMLPPRETQDQTIARASLPDLYLGDQWNDPDVVTGLSLGFIAQPKKHLLMLEVLGFVKQRELVAPKKIKFIIAGMPSPPSSGGEHLLNNLRTMVTRHGLKDDVLILPEFVPFRLLPVLYGAADFTVHICGESNHSSSGSVRQDLSYGMPVLVQHAELTADLPSDTVMFFRNQKDIESMLPLIIKQEDRRRQLSEKARAMARAHSWPGIASKHVRLYEQVSGRPLIEGRWPGVRRAIMHAMGWAGRGRAIA